MKILKKIILSTFIIIWIFNIIHSENFFYDYIWEPNQKINNNLWDNTQPNGWGFWETHDIWSMITKDSINSENSIIFKLKNIFRLNRPNYDDWTEKATDYIKMIINIILSLVSLIALTLVIYWFYLMFFSEQEEWFTKAKKIFKWVAIAIAIIWLAYFITSFIFYLYEKNTTQTETEEQ